MPADDILAGQQVIGQVDQEEVVGVEGAGKVEVGLGHEPEGDEHQGRGRDHAQDFGEPAQSAFSSWGAQILRLAMVGALKPHTFVPWVARPGRRKTGGGPGRT